MSIGILLGILCFFIALEPVGLYFLVFEGQLYRLRLNLVVDGWKYWFVESSINAACILIIGILLLLKKDRKAINFPLILLAANSWVYFTVHVLDYGFYVTNVFYPAAVSILLLINMNVLPDKKLWFLPGAVYIIRTIYLLYSYFSVGAMDNSVNVFQVFIQVLLLTFFILYPFFLQKGSLNNKIIIPNKTSNSEQSPSNSLLHAEELKKYYSLYKSGVLTEEEYQYKRKQILGE